jgi:hypothetical protein
MTRRERNAFWGTPLFAVLGTSLFLAPISPGLALVLVIFGTIFGYLTMFIIGLPAFVILHWMSFKNGLGYFIVGLVVGFAYFCLFGGLRYLTNPREIFQSSAILWTLIPFVTCILASTIFWRMARPIDEGVNYETVFR